LGSISIFLSDLAHYHEEVYTHVLASICWMFPSIFDAEVV